MKEENSFDVVVAPSFMDFAVDSDSYGSNTSEIFDDEDYINTIDITIGKQKFSYYPYGADNELPYKLMHRVNKNMILSQDMMFNVLTCYGQGLQYMDVETKEPTTDAKIRKFMLANSMRRFFLEQITDMKYHFFTVAVIILNRKGSRIVSVRHKEACYCRITKKNGLRSQYVLYGDFKQRNTPDKVEAIPLLDEINPVGDLLSRMGLCECPWTGKMLKRATERKFAVICRFPTPGNPVYPAPYWTSVLRDCWADIYHLIGIGKRAKLKNYTSVKYHVEIHDDYWDRLCDAENISDDKERAARIDQEKENIKNFLTGVHNSGKVWISGYFVDPNGKENNMVKINLVDKEKAGGDWAEDIQEASNIQCFATGVHPNLVGATPGKSQMNNSGSDKRELFTLKQAIEKAFHDMLMTVHDVIINYNGWEDKVYVDIPMITLTTLDKHEDAETVTNNTNGNGNNNNTEE